MAPEKNFNNHKKTSSIVPSHSVSGRTLMLLITIMTFLSGVTLGAVVLVQKSAIAWSSEVGREVTIQIRPIEGEVMQSNVRTAITLANSAAGVSKAFALSLDESEELLIPWLGEGLDLSALPVPRLIIVELDRADAQDIAQLKASIETIAGASLNTHAAWRQQLNTMAGTFVISGLLVLFLIASATVLAIIFATRGTMSSNRAIVDVLHFIGASNSFIAGEFQGRFLRIGLRGSIAGAVASLLFFFGAGIAVSSILPDQSGAQLGALFGTFSLGFEGIIAVSLLVPAISALTAVTSRLTVQSFLRNTS
ncbi:MAG: ABC transporter permease [Devosiaceae bacterium]|nr:ABC transporter permease [Devosiaceae bacterium]